MGPRLPAGAVVRSLTSHRDRRGHFTEIFRDDWELGVELRQWSSIVTTRPNVLRGVKVHLGHDHYVVLLAGRATFGLHDLRPGSPTHGHATTVHMGGDAMSGLFIPRGLVHGFYLHEPSTVAIADTEPYDPGDQFRIHWADPDLSIPWSCDDPIQTDEDAAAPPLREVLPEIEGRLTF